MLQREEAGRREMSVQDDEANTGKVQGLEALHRQSSELKSLR